MEGNEKQQIGCLKMKEIYAKPHLQLTCSYRHANVAQTAISLLVLCCFLGRHFYTDFACSSILQSSQVSVLLGDFRGDAPPDSDHLFPLAFLLLTYSMYPL